EKKKKLNLEWIRSQLNISFFVFEKIIKYNYVCVCVKRKWKKRKINRKKKKERKKKEKRKKKERKKERKIGKKMK
ncbi:hypothetical protein RFI_34877, partial [Reticulomyxa filosa]